MPSSPRGRSWRRWLIATGLIVLLAATVAWLALPTQYEAYALLKVAGRPPSILEKETSPPDDFSLFKATQAQLVASHVVLNGVLRESGISQLSAVRAHQDDPVSWLKDELTVDFPGDAEVMRIAIKTGRPDDSIKIANKVAQVYLKVIVENDKRLKMANEAKMESAYERQQVAYQSEAQKLSDWEKRQKTSGSEEAQFKKRMALEGLDEELATRRRLLERLEETELESILIEARAAASAESSLPSETRTADPPATVAAGEPEPSATAPLAAAPPISPLPATLLEKKREFFEQKLADSEARIAKKTDEIASLESFSALVAGKQELLDGMRLIKNELGMQVERIKIERLAAERIMKIDDAALTSENGDSLVRNVLLGTVAGSGVALMALGLAIGRSGNRAQAIDRQEINQAPV